eukprot:TRINITY_DN11959_c0_g1_i1.p1 TRINITY_DN11959_c0_g1~~TRINITY_DN11959_c0_g1_i1.p1  ORF type:complete len:504 (-),score=99.93 TRINITY_DN11959_c0_g1_i1:65-1357(-)
MTTFWKRLNEPNPKFWKHIYKSLLLLDNLLRNGSERIIGECRTRIMEIKALSEFHYIDEGKDVGLSVRERAKIIIDLLHDEKRLKDERKKASINRDKWVGMGSDSPTYFRTGQSEERFSPRGETSGSSDEEEKTTNVPSPTTKKDITPPIPRKVQNPPAASATPSNLVDFLDQSAPQNTELDLFGSGAPSVPRAPLGNPHVSTPFPTFESSTFFDPRAVAASPSRTSNVEFNFTAAPTVSNNNDWNDFARASNPTPTLNPPTSYSTPLMPTSNSFSTVQPTSPSEAPSSLEASSSKPATNDPWSQYSNLVDLTGLSVSGKEKKETKKIIFQNPKSSHPRTLNTMPTSTQPLTPTLNPMNPASAPNLFNRTPSVTYAPVSPLTFNPGYPVYNPGFTQGALSGSNPGVTPGTQANFNIGQQPSVMSGNNLLF